MLFTRTATFSRPLPHVNVLAQDNASNQSAILISRTYMPIIHILHLPPAIQQDLSQPQKRILLNINHQKALEESTHSASAQLLLQVIRIKHLATG